MREHASDVIGGGGTDETVPDPSETEK